MCESCEYSSPVWMLSLQETPVNNHINTINIIILSQSGSTCTQIVQIDHVAYSEAKVCDIFIIVTKYFHLIVLNYTAINLYFCFDSEFSAKK